MSQFLIELDQELDAILKEHEENSDPMDTPYVVHERALNTISKQLSALHRAQRTHHEWVDPRLDSCHNYVQVLYEFLHERERENVASMILTLQQRYNNWAASLLLLIDQPKGTE